MIELIVAEVILFGLVALIAFSISCRGKKCEKILKPFAVDSLVAYKAQELISWVKKVESKPEIDDTYHRMISDVE